MIVYSLHSRQWIIFIILSSSDGFFFQVLNTKVLYTSAHLKQLSALHYKQTLCFAIVFCFVPRALVFKLAC